MADSCTSIVSPLFSASSSARGSGASSCSRRTSVPRTRASQPDGSSGAQQIHVAGQAVTAGAEIGVAARTAGWVGGHLWTIPTVVCSAVRFCRCAAVHGTSICARRPRRHRGERCLAWPIAWADGPAEGPSRWPHCPSPTRVLTALAETTRIRSLPPSATSSSPFWVKPSPCTSAGLGLQSSQRGTRVTPRSNNRAAPAAHVVDPRRPVLDDADGQRRFDPHGRIHPCAFRPPSSGSLSP